MDWNKGIGSIIKENTGLYTLTRTKKNSFSLQEKKNLLGEKSKENEYLWKQYLLNPSLPIFSHMLSNSWRNGSGVSSALRQD